MTFGWMKRWFEAQKPEPPKPVESPPRKWAGRHMSEVEIIADLVAKIKVDGAAIKAWSSKDSFYLPYQMTKADDGTEPEPHAGSLMFVGMSIRNWYGLWDTDNPYTKNNEKDMLVENNIVTDPLFPDNLSGRIIDRVRKVITCAASIQRDITVCTKCGISWGGYEPIPECNGLGIPIVDRLERWAGYDAGATCLPTNSWVDLLRTVLRDARDAIRKEGQKP